MLLRMKQYFVVKCSCICSRVKQQFYYHTKSVLNPGLSLESGLLVVDLTDLPLFLAKPFNFVQYSCHNLLGWCYCDFLKFIAFMYFGESFHSNRSRNANPQIEDFSNNCFMQTSLALFMDFRRRSFLISNSLPYFDFFVICISYLIIHYFFFVGLKILNSLCKFVNQPRMVILELGVSFPFVQEVIPDAFSFLLFDRFDPCFYVRNDFFNSSKLCTFVERFFNIFTDKCSIGLRSELQPSKYQRTIEAVRRLALSCMKIKFSLINPAKAMAIALPRKYRIGRQKILTLRWGKSI